MILLISCMNPGDLANSKIETVLVLSRKNALLVYVKVRSKLSFSVSNIVDTLSQLYVRLFSSTIKRNQH